MREELALRWMGRKLSLGQVKDIVKLEEGGPGPREDMVGKDWNCQSEARRDSSGSMTQRPEVTIFLLSVILTMHTSMKDDAVKLSVNDLKMPHEHGEIDGRMEEMKESNRMENCRMIIASNPVQTKIF